VIVRRWPVTGLFFGLLWVLIQGASLTLHSLFVNFLLGTAVGLPVAYVFRRLYERRVDIGHSLRATPFVIGYAIVFTKEVIVANIDVAYRVLAPGMQLEPQVILVPLRVESDLGVTTIANSITITPGTITLDHDPDENALYVHVIDGRHPEDVIEPIRSWEDYALAIFDERHSVAEPPPGIRVHPPGGPPEPKTVRHWTPESESDDESAGEPAEESSEEPTEETGDREQ
jgi:multicomponent Na+:H+ antiporter subunit E